MAFGTPDEKVENGDPSEVSEVDMLWHPVVRLITLGASFVVFEAVSTMCKFEGTKGYKEVAFSTLF